MLKYYRRIVIMLNSLAGYKNFKKNYREDRNIIFSHFFANSKANSNSFRETSEIPLNENALHSVMLQKLPA